MLFIEKSGERSKLSILEFSRAYSFRQIEIIIGQDQSLEKESYSDQWMGDLRYHLRKAWRNYQSTAATPFVAFAEGNVPVPFNIHDYLFAIPVQGGKWIVEPEEMEIVA